jgi:hypothetical protein
MRPAQLYIGAESHAARMIATLPDVDEGTGSRLCHELRAALKSNTGRRGEVRCSHTNRDVRCKSSIDRKHSQKPQCTAIEVNGPRTKPVAEGCIVKIEFNAPCLRQIHSNVKAVQRGASLASPGFVGCYSSKVRIQIPGFLAILSPRRDRCAESQEAHDEKATNPVAAQRTWQPAMSICIVNDYKSTPHELPI